MITITQDLLYPNSLKRKDSGNNSDNDYSDEDQDNFDEIRYFNIPPQNNIVILNSVDKNNDYNINTKFRKNYTLKNDLCKIIKKYNENVSTEYMISDQYIDVIIEQLMQITKMPNQNIHFQFSNKINAYINNISSNALNYKLELLIKPNINHNDAHNIARGSSKTVKLHSLLITINDNFQIISSNSIVNLAQRKHRDDNYYMTNELHHSMLEDGFRLFNKANKIQYINLDSSNRSSIKINCALIVSYQSKYYFINTHQLVKNLFINNNTQDNINQFLYNMNQSNRKMSHLFDLQQLAYYEDTCIEDILLQLHQLHMKKDILIQQMHNLRQLNCITELTLNENNTSPQQMQQYNIKQKSILSFNDIKQYFNNYHVIKIESTKIFIKDNLGVTLELYLKQNSDKIVNNLELLKLFITQLQQAAQDLLASNKFIFDIKINNILVKDNMNEIIDFHRDLLFTKYKLELPDDAQLIDKNKISSLINQYEFFNQDRFNELASDITIRTLLSSMQSNIPLKIEISIIDYKTEAFTHTTQPHHIDITTKSGLFESKEASDLQQYNETIVKQEILGIAIIFYKIYWFYLGQPKNFRELDYTIFKNSIKMYNSILQNNNYPQNKFYLLVKSAFQEEYTDLNIFFKTAQTILNEIQ